MLRPRRGGQLILFHRLVQLGQVAGPESPDEHVSERLGRIADRRAVGVNGRLLALERLEPLRGPRLESDVLLRPVDALVDRSADLAQRPLGHLAVLANPLRAVAATVADDDVERRLAGATLQIRERRPRAPAIAGAAMPGLKARHRRSPPRGSAGRARTERFPPGAVGRLAEHGSVGEPIAELLDELLINGRGGHRGRLSRA
jgi:hypothetical protein